MASGGTAGKVVGHGVLWGSIAAGLYLTDTFVKMDRAAGRPESERFLYFAIGIWVVPLTVVVGFVVLALIRVVFGAVFEKRPAKSYEERSIFSGLAGPLCIVLGLILIVQLQVWVLAILLFVVGGWLLVRDRRLRARPRPGGTPFITTSAYSPAGSRPERSSRKDQSDEDDERYLGPEPSGEGEPDEDLGSGGGAEPERSKRGSSFASRCPDCYSTRIALGPERGDGKCWECFGTGRDQSLAAGIAPWPRERCPQCKGSGKCQTCRGSGYSRE